MEICPRCGNALDFSWDGDNGVVTFCTNCSYRTRPVYQHKKIFFLDRVHHAS